MSFMTLISIMGTDHRFLTGVGSLKGCLSEAASIRRRLRSQKWTAMGPGDWQGEDVLLEVVPYKKIFESAAKEWVSVDHFRTLLKESRREQRHDR